MKAFYWQNASEGKWGSIKLQYGADPCERGREGRKGIEARKDEGREERRKIFRLQYISKKVQQSWLGFPLS